MYKVHIESFIQHFIIYYMALVLLHFQCQIGKIVLFCVG